MGKYLDILSRQRCDYDINDQNDKSPPSSNRDIEFGRLGRFGRKLPRFCQQAFEALSASVDAGAVMRS
jgi:hypothetical protein